MSEQCLGTTSLEVEYEEKIKTGQRKSRKQWMGVKWQTAAYIEHTSKRLSSRIGIKLEKEHEVKSLGFFT